MQELAIPSSWGLTNKLEHHSGGDYANCVARGSPNSIINEKDSDKALSLQTETGNAAWLRRGCGVVEGVRL